MHHLLPLPDIPNLSASISISDDSIDHLMRESSGLSRDAFRNLLFQHLRSEIVKNDVGQPYSVVKKLEQVQFHNVDESQQGSRKKRKSDVSLQELEKNSVGKLLPRLLADLQSRFNTYPPSYRLLPYSLILHSLEYYDMQVDMDRNSFAYCVGYFAADPLRTPQLIFRSLSIRQMPYILTEDMSYIGFVFRNMRQCSYQSFKWWYLERNCSQQLKRLKLFCTENEQFREAVPKLSAFLKSKVASLDASALLFTAEHWEKQSAPLQHLPQLEELSFAIDGVTAVVAESLSSKMPSLTSLSIRATDRAGEEVAEAFAKLRRIRHIKLEFEGGLDNIKIEAKDSLESIDLDSYSRTDCFNPAATSVRTLLVTYENEDFPSNLPLDGFPNIESLTIRIVNYEHGDCFEALRSAQKLRSLTLEYDWHTINLLAVDDLCDQITYLNNRGQLEYLEIRTVQSDYDGEDYDGSCLLEDGELGFLAAGKSSLRELSIIGETGLTMDCLTYILQINSLQNLTIESLGIAWVGMTADDRQAMLEYVRTCVAQRVEANEMLQRVCQL